MKRLCLLLATIGTLTAADLTLSFKPGPMTVQDRVTGYLLRHAGEDNTFTNLCGVPAWPTSCVVTGFSIGLHQFRLHATNAVGVSDLYGSASTNVVWKPGAGSVAAVTIDAVSQKTVTMTFQFTP